MNHNAENVAKDIELVIGKALKRIREERGLRQIDVDEALHFSSKKTHKYENALTPLDVATLKSYSDFFDISIHSLLEEMYDDKWEDIQSDVSGMIRKLPDEARGVAMINLSSIVVSSGVELTPAEKRITDYYLRLINMAKKDFDSKESE